jgi:hypothetical protein
VFLPASLLEGGLCLLDTPGVGSVFAGATRATRDFVPHIDAALVVLGADPPLANEEPALIVEVTALVDTLIFVFGKADRFSDADRAEAARFSKQVLSERLGRPVETLLHVSALEHLEGTGPEPFTSARGAAGHALHELEEGRPAGARPGRLATRRGRAPHRPARTGQAAPSPARRLSGRPRRSGAGVARARPWLNGASSSCAC